MTFHKNTSALLKVENFLAMELLTDSFCAIFKSRIHSNVRSVWEIFAPFIFSDKRLERFLLRFTLTTRVTNTKWR